MDSRSAEVTVVNAGSWADRTEQLAEILGRSSQGAVIADPSGRPADPEDLAAIGDPAFWAREPLVLADALRGLGQGSGEPGGAGRSAGVITTGPDRLTLTVEEAAASLGISRASAYEAVRRGEIPSIRIGRRVLVPKASLARLVGIDPSTGTTDG
jgi:excisionase family DNA binding protein